MVSSYNCLVRKTKTTGRTTRSMSYCHTVYSGLGVVSTFHIKRP
jgi:hypothetical protein